MDNRTFTAPGELIESRGSHYHVRRWGDRGPVLLLECGLTLMSACWAWLAPELATFAQVIAYDRAGLGWSDEREEPRDASQIAEELAALLVALRLEEPAFMLGHSMGSIFNRAYLRQHPAALQGLIWLDPAHPEQIQRRGIQSRLRNLFFYIEAAQLLATKGVPAIEVPLLGHLNTLPPQEFRILRRFLRNPRHLRATAREARAWKQSADYLRGDSPLQRPILIISARRNALPGWAALQSELAALSAKTRHLTFPEMSHISMLARREHAIKVSAEIYRFLQDLQA